MVKIEYGGTAKGAAFQTYLRNFERQANDNVTLLERLVRDYVVADRDDRDRDFIKALAAQ